MERSECHFAYYCFKWNWLVLLWYFLFSAQSAGVGLGIAVMMYFLNLVANIAEVAEFLRYITPFGYCDGADIVSNGNLDGTMVAIDIVMGIAGIAVAYLHYTRKIFAKSAFRYVNIVQKARRYI